MIKTRNCLRGWKVVCQLSVCLLSEELRLKDYERHKHFKNLNLKFDASPVSCLQTTLAFCVFLSFVFGIEATQK